MGQSQIIDGVRVIWCVLLAAITLSAGLPAVAHPPGPSRHRHLADREPNQTLNPEEEAFVHTPAGFQQAGEPRTVDSKDVAKAMLRVKVVDADSGELTAARVNIVGPQGNFYEPLENGLAAWSRQHTAVNETHGPSRYYGWYFYTLGQFAAQVPVGDVRIEVWKGYECQPVRRIVNVSAGESRDLTITMERTVPMNAYGYYAGDTHIHLNRTNSYDDERALDLMAAEDIEYGFILCMNEPSHYSGLMPRQIWPQDMGFGKSSVQTRGRYGIASGQEYRARTYGHICLLMHERLVLEGLTINPNEWPVFGQIGEKTRQLGGFSFHAHGGYSHEIYADYVQQLTDGVELLQMAHYRGIGLTGWYRVLNVGYRFPAVAGSDFPYCRCLGDCRNYVRTHDRPDFVDWARGAAEGRSFFTTGPFVLLDVAGHQPGDTIERQATDQTPLPVHVRLRSEVTAVQQLELIVNGKPVKMIEVPTAKQRGQWFEVRETISIDRPCWIAARAYSTSATGRPDAEAHTNPVYVYVDGKRPFSSEDRDWLLTKLDKRIEALQERDFPEKEQAIEYFETSRQHLLSRE